ncbi:U-box domain-containing protein 8 [Phoenix dactylifera]|uniref:RING-type E3 ubiquitin transferase n=1 Tax=Phoenix dactylifera TaxID=42345 RepID=A0A8B9ARN4_PHODC|nr:U-box domain-containing protein 8 [Phoenix dactylifera]
MEVEFPDDFRCPISLEVMSDPVILSSGYTFDRASIQRWLDSGNRTCPVTKLPLPPRPSLIPNHALRSLISNFAPAGVPKTPPCPSPDPHALLASLSFPANADTLAAVLRLSKRSAAFRRLALDAGASSVLLRHAGSGDRPDLQDLALRALLHLSLDGDDARVGLVAEGAVDRLTAALRSPSAAAALAATCLTSLAMVEVNKCTIGAHPSAIAALAALLREGKGRERREAATALYELCKFPENRRRAVRAGSVPALIDLAGNGSERAVEVLGLLGKCREGREEMKRVDGFVRVLAGVLRYGSSRGIENALFVLNLVCSDGKEMALEARKEGTFELCLALAGDENGRIGKNAVGLARTLENGPLVNFL